jgi:hypothetical protein
MDERISEIIKFYVNEIERKVSYENKWNNRESIQAL